MCTSAGDVAIYLGLDSSTQGLTVTAIEVAGPRREVLFEHAIAFDSALPRYGTRHGVLASEDPRVVMAPPLMWAEALDLAMADVSASGIDLSRIRAISGSAQQHGSVYLARGASDRLGQLDPTVPLVEQMHGVFSRDRSPIWMDSSTTEDCAALTQRVGGPAALACLTGSRAFERFTGPQIRKFARADPSAYARTERIHLVSSFLASLLAGADAPLDPGDGSGTNLMDIAAARWAPAAMNATADGLESRLPALRPSWTVVGELSPYWRRRYGFPAAEVVAWSGDNPCSLIGVGLVREGRVAVSLGTSDTIFGLMRDPRIDPSGTGHVFGSPTGDFMGLTCFRNGSLARERVRDAHGLDWTAFSAALRRTPPGNGGGVMLPWFEPEITPPVLEPGVRRFDLDPSDADANVRAVIEAQMMAMSLHSAWMGVHVDGIHATGGAAANDDILQVMADVFGATVHRLGTRNSAALGAALRAWHAEGRARGAELSWDEIVAPFVSPAAAIHPRVEHASVYTALRHRYAECEARGLNENAGRSPEPPLSSSAAASR
jgi:xylulokinase